MNVNKVMIVGCLTRDPEVRSTQAGQTVTSLGVATSRTWKDKAGQKQEQAEFHNVVLWGRLGEVAGQYLTKGQLVYIDGRLQTRSYTAKDGTERRTTEIVAENMQLGPRPQGSSASAGKAPAATAKTEQKSPDDDIPTINLDDEKDDVKIEDVPF